jgi:flap endonuclease-1
MEHLFFATSQAKKSPSCSFQAQRCGLRSVSDASAFVDFALLLGTDFAPRIRNIGPSRALQYIHQYGTIEGILREEKKYVPRACVPLRPYLRAVRDARDVFVNLPPVPAPQTLEPKEYREEDVVTILGSIIYTAF